MSDAATQALWTSAEAQAATGGEVRGKWATRGLSIDTRSIEPGMMFVALKDQRDGHDFVADAFAKGAGCALVSCVPKGVPDDANLLIVPDVMEGLRALARTARARTTAKVVGVTGSVGKTSTKEMLRAVLSPQGKTHAAEKSFNNHWGVPLTLARMPRDADFAVIEIGMNAPGEIAPLAELADLDVAIVTTVAPAHLAAFESLSGIAHEKASIFDGLRPGGAAIVNDDLKTTGILLDRAKAAGAKIIRFGTEAGADVMLTDCFVKEAQTISQAHLEQQPITFKLQTPGRHFALNALTVLAATQVLGVDLARVLGDLGRWTPFEGRGARERISMDVVDPNLAFDLIDDAYNANPASTGAALDMLATLEPMDGIGRISRGRRIAVLGDMLELGEGEAELHAALADHAAMNEIDVVHCVGPRSHALWEALPQKRRGHWEETAQAFAPCVRRIVDAGDIVLVKGSLGIGLKQVVEALRNLGQPAPKND